MKYLRILIGLLVASVGHALTISVNNSGLFWSPYSWNVNGSTSSGTCTSGAYLKFNFTGSTACSISITGSNWSGFSTFPIIKYTLNNGPITESTLSSSTTSVSIATGLSTGSVNSVVFWLVSNVTSQDRWTTPTSVLSITGITLDTGGSVSLPTLAPMRALFYGDSITEGANDGDGTTTNDASRAWPWYVGPALQAEWGQIGYEGQGWVRGGDENVPPIFTPSNDTSSAWNKYWTGASRLSSGTLTPAPDYIIINEGTNDQDFSESGSAVIASVSGLLAALRTAAPNAKIFVMVPFGGMEAANILTGYTNYETSAPDAKCYYLNESTLTSLGLTDGGSATAQSTDGIHPYVEWQAQNAAIWLSAIQVILAQNRTSGY
jgi:lysophospholipase L1-like esterase